MSAWRYSGWLPSEAELKRRLETEGFWLTRWSSSTVAVINGHRHFVYRIYGSKKFAGPTDLLDREAAWVWLNAWALMVALSDETTVTADWLRRAWDVRGTGR